MTSKNQAKAKTVPNAPNQKKKSAQGAGMGASLLKKNEFTLIMAGALVVTLAVFFFFFRSSESGSGIGTTGTDTKAGAMDRGGLEQRLTDLEASLARLELAPDGQGREIAAPIGGLAPLEKQLEQRIERLETAVTVKIDSLIERMGRLEREIVALKSKARIAVAKAAGAPVPKSGGAVKKTSAQKPGASSPAKTKTAKVAAKKKPFFHTVQKGETLWRIARKYKTTVPALRKLNNLSPDDKIYPGNNVLVR